ncbi:MAG TPA: tRNA (N6-threonylcarbamoyladenosine(37)-N6)-methyltransferase TrmO [Candidatus Acidoferrales bacterium]|nr:tRNA (N6-threonylcarbamoyladenosine(37)-N6)-methyltransferase TrmO [Candidatus Acidoferrales bacterium]
MKPDDASFEIQIIGHARTPWNRREDAPHQPTAAADSEGVIEIAPGYRPALADLGTFERIWVIFLFDRSRGWAPRVKPPRGGSKRGVFATRAPNRPSQIGLTNVALKGVDVDAGLVRVQGIDLLDATPILDIKPYLPMIDAWPQAKHGWLEAFLDAGIEPRLKKPYRPPRAK